MSTTSDTTMPAQQAGTAQTPAQSAQNQDPAQPERTFTQADLNRIIAERVGPLQAKASEYDKLAESQKSEAQKQAEALASLQRENQELKASQARRDAAQAANLPAEAYALVTGSAPEEIDASIKAVQSLVKKLTGPQTPPPDPSQGQVGRAPVVRSISEARQEAASKYAKKNN